MLTHFVLARLKTCLTDTAQCNWHKGKENPQPDCSTLYLTTHFETVCLLHVFPLAGKVSMLVFAAPPLSKTHSCSRSKQPLVRSWEGQSLGAASISAFLKTKILFQEINFFTHFVVKPRKGKPQSFSNKRNQHTVFQKPQARHFSKNKCFQISIFINEQTHHSHSPILLDSN